MMGMVRSCRPAVRTGAVGSSPRTPMAARSVPVKTSLGTDCTPAPSGPYRSKKRRPTKRRRATSTTAKFSSRHRSADRGRCSCVKKLLVSGIVLSFRSMTGSYSRGDCDQAKGPAPAIAGARRDGAHCQLSRATLEPPDRPGTFGKNRGRRRCRVGLRGAQLRGASLRGA